MSDSFSDYADWRFSSGIGELESGRGECDEIWSVNISLVHLCNGAHQP